MKQLQTEDLEARAEACEEAAGHLDLGGSWTDSPRARDAGNYVAGSLRKQAAVWRSLAAKGRRLERKPA